MMRRILSIICMMFVCLANHAQFSSVNSFMRKEIVSYIKNDKGLYVETSNKMIDVVNGVIKSYAYDKKAQNLYVLTETSNVVITLTKDYAKVIKKNKDIPKLSGEELAKVIEKHSEQLFERITVLNCKREQQITDSINKAKQDSIDEVNKHKAIVAAQKKAREDYRSSHKCVNVPLGNCSMICEICGELINSTDVFRTIGICNDSIYYMTSERGKLGLIKREFHQSKIPSSLKSDKDFLYHCEVFKDSLTMDSIDYPEAIYYLYSKYKSIYWSALKKTAPFGFVENWGWEKEYSMVTFDIQYTNTNSKTIKYLTVYFKITNDVGDIRKTGYFQGTGPLVEGETASWNWDSSSYFIAGDASKMSLTKIVLTYMDGSKKVLSGKYLRVN